MKRRTILTFVIIAILSFTGINGLFSQVVVKVKPVHTKVVIVKPKTPGKNYIWVDGHWKYNSNMNKYVWVNGKWVRKPQNNSVWIAGRWKKVRGGWKYVPGRWA